MNRIQTILAAIALSLSILLTPLLAEAAYPTREIFDLAVQGYSMKLDSDRSSCANYANPNTLQKFDNYRTLFVFRMTDRDSPGPLCNGVFESQVIRVKCATQEVSYGGVLVRPEEKWHKDTKVAQKVCEVQEPVDGKIFDQAGKDYSMLLESGRGCSIYANSKTLSRWKNERYISVLNQRGENDGTICKGVFRFLDLTVRCQTGEISYAEHLGSPATWKENWQKKAQVADRICNLPLFSSN